MSALAEAAATYARRGWPILPTGRDKRPLTPNGLLDATTDLARIETYWAAHPEVNVAVRTGEPSGLVVLDIDGQDGADNLAELERLHGPLPQTASVKTPRGSHYYFVWPGVPVKTTAGAIAPGIDIRGDGGYVVAPPSSTSAGGYEWDETAPPAPMPAWLVELTRETSHDARAAAPVSEWVSLLADGLPEGERNHGIARLTGHLLRRHVDVDVTVEIVRLVAEHRCNPPLPSREVERTIDSICARELRRRQEGRS